ncbi:Berberine bridge enzyme-like 21 [Vigna angularis]|uniref:Berberine bridge enzyme-like 21 n=2 Tax=Phaseolus angularis TaxID=3914 RepID=A0A8T0K9K3_PHAAN|nr:Berberine bridge enzyme-like 21 [Vigna angularis]
MTMTMLKPCFGYLSFVILLLTVLTLSVAEAADSAIHDSFLKCLTEKTKMASGELSKIVFAQNNPSFTTVLNDLARNERYRTTKTPKPVLVVTPLKELQVQGTVICAKTAKLQIRTRSGGHDYEGLSYVSKEPFIIVDMFNLRAVTVDVKNEVAVVQAGATLGEVYYRIWEKSKVHGFPAGVCPTVGAGGHISGAGYGNMVRKYGMTVDNLIDAKIVDAKGNLLDKKSMGEDLFWAIKGGGGGSFGVIVSFTIKLVPVPEKVTVFRVEKTMETKVTATNLLVQWQQVAPTTDHRLFMRVLLQLANSEAQKGKMIGQASIVAMFLGGADEVVSILGKEFPLLGLKKENCTEVSWIESVLWWNDGKSLENGDKPETLLDRNLNSSSFMKRKSDFVEKAIPKEGLETMFETMIELKTIGLVFNPYGGKMAEISSDATPFPRRKGTLFKVQYSVSWDDPSPAKAQENTNGAKKLHSVMTPYVSSNPRGAYLNYRDLDIGVNNFGPNSFEEGKIYGTEFFGKNFDRLVDVKTKVDPENFFRNEQSIPVRASKA